MGIVIPMAIDTLPTGILVGAGRVTGRAGDGRVDSNQRKFGQIVFETGMTPGPCIVTLAAILP
jgi:hypothetical protein